MKKILPVFFAASMLLAACGGKTAAVVESSSVIEETEVETTETEEESTETEAETETETEETSAPAGNAIGETPAELSDDLYSFQLQVNDIVYQLPMTYEQFTGLGWTYNDDPNEELTAGRYMSTQVFTNGKLKCYAGIANFDVNTKPVKDCYIISLSFETSQVKDTTAVIMLPGGISLGGNYDEAIALYGTPTSEYDNETSRRSASYSQSSNDQIKIESVYENRDVIGTISVKNMTKPDDFVAGEISSEVPEIVTRYEAPTAMSDDFADFIVEYGGNLYQLPAPVSEFISNGWTIYEDGSETTIDGRGGSWVTLMKDNQKLKVIASNYDENATAIENGFVTNIVADNYQKKTSLIIARNITIGMTRAELESALSGVEYTMDKESNTSSYYKISPTGSLVDDYDISVSKETDLVTTIDVRNEPKYDVYVNRK